jgi:hypothetical protein
MLCYRFLLEPKNDLTLEEQVNTLNEKGNMLNEKANTLGEKVVQIHLTIESIQQQTKQVRFDSIFFLFLSSALLNR